MGACLLHGLHLMYPVRPVGKDFTNRNEIGNLRCRGRNRDPPEAAYWIGCTIARVLRSSMQWMKGILNHERFDQALECRVQRVEQLISGTRYFGPLRRPSFLNELGRPMLKRPHSPMCVSRKSLV